MFGASYYGKAYFGGTYWGPASGVVLVPTPANVTVRASAVGFFGGQMRAVGDEFDITAPAQFHPSWMVLVDDPPADWDATIEARSIATENLRVEFNGRAETRTTEEAFGV